MVMIIPMVVGGFGPRVGVRLACGCDGSAEVARMGAGSTVRSSLRSLGWMRPGSARRWSRDWPAQPGERVEGL